MTRAIELSGGWCALTDLVAMDGRPTWLPEDIVGFDPSSCYLLLEPDSGFLVDTGLAVHGEALAEKVVERLGGRPTLTIFFTRAEFDNIGGLDRIARRIPITNIVTPTPNNPLNDLPQVMQKGLAVPVEHVKPGATITTAGGRRLSVLDPALRTLATGWLHDPAAGILFTSDSMGHLHLTDAEESPVVGSGGRQQPEVADVARHLLAKFGWLEMAVTEQPRTKLAAAAGDRRIEYLAPQHGCILQGQKWVQANVALVDEALKRVGVAEPEEVRR